MALKSAPQIQRATQAPPRLYRFDFALIVITGNRTRYETIRPIVEADPTIRASWYPIRTWVEGDWIRPLPPAWRVRARHFLDSWQLLVRPSADAVIIHAFETQTIYAVLHRLLGRRAVIITHYDGESTVPAAGPGIRGWLHRVAVEETDLFVPWSLSTAAGTRRLVPDLPPEKLWTLHPGLDLNRWPLRKPKRPAGAFKLLFVGGDLVRKGIHTLLGAFEQLPGGEFKLDVATQSSFLTAGLRSRLMEDPRITTHLDLKPNSGNLRRLFADADAFVLPTNSDTSSWVALEAMATGLPVIITSVGGIPDIVQNDETGLLVPRADPAALAQAIARLSGSETLRLRLIDNARRHVEANFDTRKNTERLLDRAKEIVDARQADRAQRLDG